MYTLREFLTAATAERRFLVGVELVSTRGTMEDHTARETRAFASVSYTHLTLPTNREV